MAGDLRQVKGQPTEPGHVPLDRILTTGFIDNGNIGGMGLLGQNPGHHGDPGADIHDRMIVNLLCDDIGQCFQWIGRCI